MSGKRNSAKLSWKLILVGALCLYALVLFVMFPTLDRALCVGERL